MERAPRVRSAELRRAAAVAALAVIWLAMLWFGRGPLDRSIYEGLYAGGRPALILAARVITAFGEPSVLIAAGFACAAWLWWRGRGRVAIVLLLVVLVGRGLAEVQKYEIARVRPALEPHLVVVKTSSFPSGHATSSMIFYLTVALMLAARTRWRWAAVAVALAVSALVGASRVMLGVHWPSDVLGGWAFGLLWVLVTLKPAERLFRTDSA